MCRGGEAPWDAAQMAAELALPHVGALGAVVGGAVAGVVFWSVAADEGEIRQLFVARSHRRRGVGGRLLAAALAAIAAAGGRRCYLEVRAGNAAARRLYVKKGFRVCGTRPGYYRHPSEDAVVLVWEMDDEKYQGD